MQLEYFRMIDRVVAYDAAAVSIECAAQVPPHSTIFEGHFPGHPLMPGVLLLETMAQASGYLILQRQAFNAMPFLIGATRLRLRRFVAPGEALDITATLDHEGSGYAVTRAAVTTGAENVCDADIKFRLMPFASPAFKNAMAQQAAALGLVLPESAAS